MAKRTKRLTSQGEAPGEIRINKFLSEAGVCSRREADHYITEGKVKIDGVTAEMGSKVTQGSQVTFCDQPVKREDKLVLIAFNKPEGIVCTTDRRDPDNIIDYINYGMRIYPIGRLDKDSEGLILLTNDGNIVNKILRAENNHEKEYLVTVNKEINPEFIKSMSQGVPILDTVTNPCDITQIDKYTFQIILTQGLNRQIRRMCEYFGYRVVSLKRIRIMNILLGRLKTGDFRNVTEKEIEELNQSFQVPRSINTGVSNDAKSDIKSIDEKTNRLQEKQLDNRQAGSNNRSSANKTLKTSSTIKDKPTDNHIRNGSVSSRRANSTRSNNPKDNSTRNNNTRNHNARYESTGNASTRNDSARNDITRNDNVRNDSTRNHSVRNDNARNDRTRNHSARNDNTRYDNTRYDNTRYDNTRNDSTRNDSTRNDGTRNRSYSIGRNNVRRNSTTDNGIKRNNSRDDDKRNDGTRDRSNNIKGNDTRGTNTKSIYTKSSNTRGTNVKDTNTKSTNTKSTNSRNNHSEHENERYEMTGKPYGKTGYNRNGNRRNNSVSNRNKSL